ncbi:MAG: C40 family peptidase [Deltaproteobacteria bacterium]|nr:C40 family peptidase [Deltaproteobacteria bacterium]MBW1845604.1 C40 family peptidase [Deltaproteobacteria bacterium]MBW2032031.1 C40 family peptidase [Deltaproteobacteria bacterium]
MMTEDEKRSVMIQVAMSYHGTFYSWGGDDPDSFDCSGLLVECGKSIGVLPRRGDWPARGLYARWIGNEVTIPKAGDVVFWENKTKNDIVHVEIILNSELSIGASGGGSRTKTRQDAIRDNAFIKIRPFKTRPYIKGFFNPYI